MHGHATAEVRPSRLPACARDAVDPDARLRPIKSEAPGPGLSICAGSKEAWPKRSFPIHAT